MILGRRCRAREIRMSSHIFDENGCAAFPNATGQTERAPDRKSEVARRKFSNEVFGFCVKRHAFAFVDASSKSQKTRLQTQMAADAFEQFRSGSLKLPLPPGARHRIASESRRSAHAAQCGREDDNHPDHMAARSRIGAALLSTKRHGLSRRAALRHKRARLLLVPHGRD